MMSDEPQLSREQLDAIRQRLVAAKTLRSFTGSVDDMIFGQRAMRDVEALLAEVERLTADPLPAAAWVREVERAAFKRGVAAMREAAAVWVEAFCSFSKAARVRALPAPEDKS